jgi:DNA-directed RNA polymerase specialized sigma24 family protein
MRWLPWRVDLDTRAVAAVDEPPDLRAARTALRTLAARDRMLVLLRAQGLSYRDIAGAAGLKEASVGRLLARALDRWKRAVGRAR